MISVAAILAIEPRTSAIRKVHIVSRGGQLFGRPGVPAGVALDPVQSNNHAATLSVCFPVTEVQPLII